MYHFPQLRETFLSRNSQLFGARTAIETPPPLRTSRKTDLTQFGFVLLCVVLSVFVQPCAQFVKPAFFGVVYRLPRAAFAARYFVESVAAYPVVNYCTALGCTKFCQCRFYRYFSGKFCGSRGGLFVGRLRLPLQFARVAYKFISQSYRHIALRNCPPAAAKLPQFQP